jgi:hypothetical protein
MICCAETEYIFYSIGLKQTIVLRHVNGSREPIVSTPTSHHVCQPTAKEIETMSLLPTSRLKDPQTKSAKIQIPQAHSQAVPTTVKHSACII